MEGFVQAANQRREQLQAEATAMGIDDDYISLLVDTFYTRVRQDSVLGPIFEKAIGDNWGTHLAKMKDFWASVAFNAGRYTGKPVPKHQKLNDVTPQHFTLWLSLFRQTLEETAPSDEVVTYFMERAERIAKSLQLAMFYKP